MSVLEADAWILRQAVVTANIAAGGFVKAVGSSRDRCDSKLVLRNAIQVALEDYVAIMGPNSLQNGRKWPLR